MHAPGIVNIVGASLPGPGQRMIAAVSVECLLHILPVEVGLHLAVDAGVILTCDKQPHAPQRISVLPELGRSKCGNGMMLARQTATFQSLLSNDAGQTDSWVPFLRLFVLQILIFKLILL